MADLTGQTLGQYKLGSMIGKGGMAAVYRARQESMDRDVAIKIMAMELTSNTEFVARFEREARVIARLQHPHILPVIDFGRNGPYVYLVMRLVEGGVLSDRLQQTTLSLEQTDLFLGQIASALEYAHQRGVVHRDLKPNNVLLDELDNCYLTDFGIAKMLAGTTTSAQLTSTGSVMGTPSYMAPEQWRSEPVDARTDIYALGIIIYEMLMGTLPFQAETPFAMMYKHFDSPPPPPRAINPDLPEPLEHVVLRAMAKNPNDRYPSAKRLADDFHRALMTMPPEMLAAKLPRATAEQIEAATPARQTTPLPPAAGATMATNVELVPPGSIHTMAPATSRPAPQVAAREGGGRGLLVGGVLAAVIVIAAIVIAVVALGGKGGGGKKTPEATSAAVLPVATQTTEGGVVIATPGGDKTGQPSPEPTLKISSETPQFSATPAATATVTHTPTITPSETPSHTPSPLPSLTPSNTPDLQASASALLAQRFTQTAQSWTNTPTPDIEQTVVAAMTGTANAWTDTPTNTPTATFTVTPLPTITPPPSATPLPPPTLPPLPSRTPIPTATQVPTSTPIPTQPPQPTITPAGYCPGSLPTRMMVGAGGRTTLQPPDATRVRQAPGFSSPVVNSIPAGEMFNVIDGPQCADNVKWWKIDVYDTTGRWSGWVGEGQNTTYWIEPFNTGPIDCPGAPAPRMIPGQNGRVALNPPSPNNVRAQPNKTSQLLGAVQPGGTFQVVSGPACDTASQYRYWLIRTSRLEGWMAEGIPGQYWMEPWP